MLRVQIGRTGRNRTFVDCLKGSYSTIELRSHMFTPQFTENSITSRDVIKRCIIKNKLITYECKECKIIDKYNNKNIILHLDHINGIPNDNRLENLRFLCPNCHSQTTTYCGRNIGIERKYCSCGNNKHYYSLRCKKCNEKHRLEQDKKKINWPSVEELLNKLKTMSFSALGRELGISCNAIRKHIRKRTSCSTN